MFQDMREGEWYIVISELDEFPEMSRAICTDLRNEQAQHLDRGDSLREAQMENTESP